MILSQSDTTLVFRNTGAVQRAAALKFLIAGIVIVIIAFVAAMLSASSAKVAPIFYVLGAIEILIGVFWMTRIGTEDTVINRGGSIEVTSRRGRKTYTKSYPTSEVSAVYYLDVGWTGKVYAPAIVSLQLARFTLEVDYEQTRGVLRFMSGMRKGSLRQDAKIVADFLGVKLEETINK